MFKYTRHTLNKIEDIYKDLKFRILYEKGNFQSGYCIVDQKDIIVINKFFDTEARINILIEILEKIEMQTALLSHQSIQMLEQIKKLGIQSTLFENAETD